MLPASLVPKICWDSISGLKLWSATMALLITLDPKTRSPLQIPDSSGATHFGLRTINALRSLCCAVLNERNIIRSAGG